MKKTLLVMALISALSGVNAMVAAAEQDIKVAAPIADPSEGRKAQEALQELVRAYETGNVGLIRSRLDPAMIGYQRFIDGVIQDSNRMKLVRIHLKDVQVLAGPDVAVIQANWEKRFLSATGLAPGLFTGHSMFLLHRENAGGWKVAAFGGDNLFASQSGVQGRLNLIYAVDGIRFEVIDPDMAGSGVLPVTVISTSGVAQLVLSETSPGNFFVVSAPTARSGSLVTMQYLDANPGGGRPPSTLTSSIVVP
jgi:hypothetical protein